MSGQAPESTEEAPPTNRPAAVQPPPREADDSASHISGHAHAHRPRIEFRFLEQLKRRNVIRVGILYLVVSWLILDPIHVVFHMLEVPVWANRLVVVLIAIGFPAVLLFAWVYEITPDGLKPTVEVEPSRSIRRQTAQRLNGAIMVVLVLAIAYLLIDKFWLSKEAGVTQQPVTLVKPAIPAGVPAATAISEKSVAVLPFLDMSEKKDQEYFSDGLSEELIDMLTKIQDLRVPARTSSFYFKGKSEDIPTIGRRLMVAHVLEGSVRKYGNHLRVTAQLVRADSGYHLWSQTYDRNLDDIFKVQADIAGSVVKALKISIMKAEVPQVAPTANSEAHTLYLRALSLARLATSADSVQAYKDLRRALSLDPDFALAWAALAELLTDDSWGWGNVISPAGGPPAGQRDNNYAYWLGVREQERQLAKDAAQRGLQLNSDLAETHLAMALVLYWVDWNWAAANSELKKVRELDPANATATEAAAGLANTMGRFEEGLKLAALALTQDPLGTAYWDIGAAKHRLGSLDEAAAAYQHLIELYPTGTAYHYRRALVLLSKHDAQAALDEMERENTPWYRQAGMPLVLDALGRRAESDRELAVVLAKYPLMGYQISYVYAGRNDPENAMLWLERAYEAHDTGLLSVKHDPMLRNIEHDSRYKTLLRKMKVPE
jgi:adenylate cyclase